MNTVTVLPVPDALKLGEMLKEKEEARKRGHVRTYTIEVITPMFGGGVEAGVVDEEMPIRATEIRGHLRFWWRALFGVRHESPEKLFEAENKLWGSTAKKSPIGISIHIISRGEKEVCGEFYKSRKGKNRWRFKPKLPGYVLFPFKPDQKEEANKEIPERAWFIQGIKFNLSLSLPNTVEWRNTHENEVRSALWAWVNFGGVGARTRRGCGALFCKDFSPQDRDQFNQDCEKYLQKGWTKAQKDWCSLQRIISGPYQKDVNDTWLDITNAYQHFRQGVDFARNPGRNDKKPGRSRWPEPESIRKITEQRNARHAQIDVFVMHPCHAFPRAVLGLPIITHFQNEENDEKKDPVDTELLPFFQNVIQMRMGSPLILKPLVLQNGKAITLLAILNHPQPQSLILKITGKEKPFHVPGGAGVMKNSLFAQYPNSPLSGSQDGDVLIECINHIKFHLKKLGATS